MLIPTQALRQRKEGGVCVCGYKQRLERELLESFVEEEGREGPRGWAWNLVHGLNGEG